MQQPNPGANPDARLPDAIHLVPQMADQPLLGQETNCYLLRTGSGVLVVDPPSSQEEQVAEILAVAEGESRGILVTHTHPDHVGGVPPLAERTRAPVYAHPLAQEVLTQVEVHPVSEGDVLYGWVVFETPGHRADSLTFFSPQHNVAVVGDLVAGYGTVVIDPQDGDLFAYLRSLERLRDEVRPTLLLPGHGPPVDDPQRLLTHYIDHRLAREQRVVDALQVEPRPLESLLPVVYSDTSPLLYPLAERSLLAHLIKLEKEGRAVRLAEGWRAT